MFNKKSEFGDTSYEELNAIYAATPPYLHCGHVIRTAEAGKHALCKKPMAMTTEECQRMVNVSTINVIRCLEGEYDDATYKLYRFYIWMECW